MSIETPKIKFKSLPKTICFLVSGKAGVGKTTFSNMLYEIASGIGYSTRVCNFAYTLKAFAKSMGWDGNKDTRGRKFLQELGGTVRNYNPDTWARFTFDRILESDSYPYDIISIDDWRFPNEYEYIIKNEPLYHPVTVRILADSLEILRGTPEYTDISETSLDAFKFDYIIRNDLSLEDLNKSAQALMEHTIGKVRSGN